MKKIQNFWFLTLMMLLPGCNPKDACTPTRKDIVVAVFASGHILTRHHYNITAQNEGYLLKACVEEGDSVGAHQVLFQLDNSAQAAIMQSSQAIHQAALDENNDNSTVLAQLEAREKQAQKKYIHDSINFERYQQLISSNAVSKSDVDHARLLAENAKQEWLYTQNLIADTRATLQLTVSKTQNDLAVQRLNLQHHTLRSRAGGVITRIFKTEGDWVRRGEVVAEVGSGPFIAKLLVAEEDISKIGPGQKVFIELNTNRNSAEEAFISKVYPYFDASEQSFVAEALLTRQFSSLKSYTQLQANIIIAEKKQAITIPTAYLINDSCVRCSEGTKRVSLGIRNNDWAEVLAGLQGDEQLLLPNRGSR